MIKPPIAKRIPKVDLVHGEQRQDDYFWMRNKEDPEVIAYLEAENAHADAQIAAMNAIPEPDLYKEILARIKETDLSVPYRDGRFFYYGRTEQGKQYSILCRKPGSLDAPEEVTLDLNQLAEGEKYLGIGAYAISDDANLLAYSTDVTGFREYTLHIKDLRTGALGPERIPRVSSVAWAADNRTLLYTTDDDAKRSYRLWRHTLGESQDQLLYEETDELFRVHVGRTRSKAYLIVESQSHTASEVRVLSAAEPAGAMRLVTPREKDHEYDVDHHGDLFYVRTNSGGRNFRLCTTPVQSPGREHWKEMVPHREDVMIEGVSMFKGHYVRFEREAGLPRLTVTDFAAGASHRVEFPEPAYSVSPDSNAEFDTRLLRFSYESLVTPRSVFDYDVVDRTRTLLKQTEVLGGYAPEGYASERIFATASDGTRVPISMVYKKGLVRDGKAPLLLYGYGAYGHSMPASFGSTRLSLVDRGVVYAIAHIRGGAEMGKKWHDQGRMLQKRNTFTDFIACAEHLVAERYTSHDRLVIQGGSAGGLLIGAVVNMRPDLCRAAILQVPFVDVINTMLDTSLPLTVGEFEEWGNPQLPADYAYMRSYCPYSNVAAQAYPVMLVKTGLNDSQVMYWEPAKLVAKLRVTKTDDRPLLFKTVMAGGHSGASGRYDQLHEVAYIYAFMLAQLGITSP